MEKNKELRNFAYTSATKSFQIQGLRRGLAPTFTSSADAPSRGSHGSQAYLTKRLDMTLHWSGVGAAPLMSPRQDETSEPLLYAGWMAGPYRCKDATRGRNDDPVTPGLQVPRIGCNAKQVNRHNNKFRVKLI
nr:hypothetical protein [Tanacetum cinerariifolium]